MGVPMLFAEHSSANKDKGLTKTDLLKVCFSKPSIMLDIDVSFLKCGWLMFAHVSFTAIFSS